MAVGHHFLFSPCHLLLNLEKFMLPTCALPGHRASSLGIVVEIIIYPGTFAICNLPPLSESEQIKFFSTNKSLGGICCVNVCLRYFLRTQGPESKLQNEHKNHIKILRMVCRGYAPIRLSQFGPNSLSCPPHQGSFPVMQTAAPRII